MLLSCFRQSYQRNYQKYHAHKLQPCCQTAETQFEACQSIASQSIAPYTELLGSRKPEHTNSFLSPANIAMVDAGEDTGVGKPSEHSRVAKPSDDTGGASLSGWTLQMSHRQHGSSQMTPTCIGGTRERVSRVTFSGVGKKVEMCHMCQIVPALLS